MKPYSERLADAQEVYRRGKAELKKGIIRTDQKYHHGDRVIITIYDQYGKLRTLAGTIDGSYNDQYHWLGGQRIGEEPKYTIILDKGGEASWFAESMLSMEKQ